MHPAILLLAGLTAAATPLPKSASIIDVPAERRDSGDHIGNVKVLFTDGHSEMWTKLGHALMPKVAKSGLVGWTTFQTRNDRGVAVNSTLRICWPPEGRHKDFKATPRPYIENWHFAEGDTMVIIKTHGVHGPEEFLKYRLSDGKLLGEAIRNLDTPLPDWAVPDADAYADP